jgi:hypothetical protein
MLNCPSACNRLKVHCSDKLTNLTRLVVIGIIVLILSSETVPNFANICLSI